LADEPPTMKYRDRILGDHGVPKAEDRKYSSETNGNNTKRLLTLPNGR
jgi:hypothetical protein